nr:hypothetical protein LTR18_001185 [Exophiala xenobiotica]
MASTVSRSVSYHAVSPSEPTAISNRNSSHDDQGPAEHPASRLISRKPVPFRGTKETPKQVDTTEKVQDPDAAERTSRKSPAHGIFKILSIWWLEMICCAIFMGAFLAIVATIYSYQGRPLPEWPYHLTVNTLIAIYVVILKAALLLVTAQGIGQLKWRWFERERPLIHLADFDDASRGVWGSLTLLWMLKARYTIASCGAFITVAALLIDPFAQQVISTYECQLEAPSSHATIPRTNMMNESGSHIGAGENAITIGLQKAINAGIYNPGTPVEFDCPTGNCTFPDVYHSVGYCSSCIDVTDSLVITYVVATGGYNYTNISLPGYWEDDYGYLQWVDPISATIDDPFSTPDNPSSPTNVNFVMNYTEKAIVAAELNIGSNVTCPEGSQVQWGCGGGSSGGASTCTIEPCVRSYKAYIAGGRLSEELASASNLRIWQAVSNFATNNATINIACLSPGTRDHVTQLELTLEDNGWLSTPNLSMIQGSEDDYFIPTENEAFPNISIPAECVYQFDVVQTDGAVQRFLETYLNDTVGMFPPSVYAYDYSGPAQLLVMWNNSNLDFENLNSTFANIAESLTTRVRQNSPQSHSRPAYGVVLQQQTCVHVRWAWLAYPAALIALTLTFLTAMAIKTGRGEMKRHDWKSEPLAMIFHGLDDQTIKMTEAERLVTRKDMRDAAKQVVVRLGEDENGAWRVEVGAPASVNGVQNHRIPDHQRPSFHRATTEVMASIEPYNHIDPQLRTSSLSSPPRPREPQQQHYPNGVPAAYSPLQPSPNPSYQSIQTPGYYPQNPQTHESPDDASPLGNPADPNDLKRPRACEACRQLKVKCELDDNHPSGSCKRCAKANRQCIVTAPSRKRQKKTDSRVAELERKIDALTATLAAQGGADGDVTVDPARSQSQIQPPRPPPYGEQWHGPPPPVTSLSPQQGQQGIKRKIADYDYFGGELHKTSSPSFKSTGSASHYQPVVSENTRTRNDSDDLPPLDLVDRGIFDLNTARKCFERYMAEMCEHLPLVVFPPGTNADDVRKNKPVLFLAISAVASSTIRPDLQPRLISEITRALADRVIFRGEKSLELVQAIQVTTCFYQPPEKYEELNFNQLIHIAAVMAMDLGMGKRSKRGGPNMWRPYNENKRPLSDPNSAETRRCWLGCYYMCSNSSMSLRRPLLARWSPYADECVEILNTAADALSSDKALCHLVRAQHMAEDIGVEFSMDDPLSQLTLTDQKTQYHLKNFERRLKEWHDTAGPDMLMKPIIQHTEGIINLYMHEIAMHHNHNIDDFRPPFNATPIEGPPDPDNVTPAHIEALTTCIHSAHAAFDAFLSMDVKMLRALPTLFFVRSSYAAVALIKLYSAVSAKGSKFAQIFKTKDLKVEYYLDRMIDMLTKTCENGMSRVAHKFSLIFNMLKSWHMKRMEPINNGRSRVPKQHTPAGRTISQPVYKAVPPQQDPAGLAWNPQNQNRASMDQNTQAHQQARNGLQMLSDAAMGPGPAPAPAPPAVMPQPQPQPQQWIQPMSQSQMLPGVTEMGMHNQGMMPYGMPGQELGPPMDFTSDELMAFGFGDEFLAMNFGFEQGNWI